MPSSSLTRSILVVDDEEDIRDYLQVLLKRAGYQVSTAGDGQEALALLALSSFDLVLADLMMPVIDGWTLVATLRAEPRFATLPIVVLSATTLEVPPEVTAVLVKPSSPAEILAVVTRVLERRQRPRFGARFAVEAQNGHGPVPAVARDLSRGGVGFESAVQAHVGQLLTLKLDLPRHGPVLVESEVRYVATAPAGWRVGARFLRVRENGAALDAALSELEQPLRNG